MGLFPLMMIFGLAELFFLVKIGSSIGAFTTLLWCVVTAIAGFNMARLQGIGLFLNSYRELQMGRMPATNLFDALMIALGGIFLVLPGFISDGVGILLMIPGIRSLMKESLFGRLESHFQCRDTYHVHMDSKPVEEEQPRIIDVR